MSSSVENLLSVPKRNQFFRVILFVFFSQSSLAWVPPSLVSSTSRRTTPYTPSPSFAVEPKAQAEDTINSAVPVATKEDKTTSKVAEKAVSDDEDDDDYEYIEYENLSESEFVNSEWLVGTNWDRNAQKIDETWCRLIVDANGKNVAVWGDKSEGSWNLDVASQFLSVSKENILAGKEIWACTVDDFYFLQGTVRAWTFWSAASVIGQWQGRRLGVDKEEAGTAPWFEPQEEAEGEVDSEAD